MNRILKFWMKNCSPCTAIDMVIKDLATKGELNKGVHPIDIRSITNRELVRKIGVRGVPLIIEVDENNNELRRLTDRTRQGIKDFINYEDKNK